jgi:hypothetical protein
MGPDPFRTLAAWLASTRDPEKPPDEATALLAKLAQIEALLWREHEAFVLVPLVRIVMHVVRRTPTISQRLNELVPGSTSDQEPPPLLPTAR